MKKDLLLKYDVIYGCYAIAPYNRRVISRRIASKITPSVHE